MAKQELELFDNLPELMTAAEVTDLLRIHRRSLDRYVARGLISKIKIAGAVRFSKEEVRKLAGLKG